MDALITAGGIPLPDEPLYPNTRGGYKVMLPLAGKPMIQWVLEAIDASSTIDRVIVIGLPEFTDLKCKHETITIKGQGDVLSNIKAGAEEVLRVHPDATKAFIISGDVPCITGQMIDWMAEQIMQGEADVYYPVVERADMEKVFSESRRTYVHLKDGNFCSGDVLGINPQAAGTDSPLWHKISAARKNPVQQAGILGIDTLFLLLLHQLNLEDAQNMVSKRMGINGKVVRVPHAEMGMDVDKPFQLDMAAEYLERKLRHETGRPGRV